MILIFIIICATFLVLGVAALALFLKNRRNDSVIVIRDGMNADTKQRSSESAALFNGIRDDRGTFIANQGSAAGVPNRNYHFYLVDSQKGEWYDLQFREVIGIGRAEHVQGIENFLTIRNDMRISGYHCRIFVYENQIYIEDMGSKNHTYVNGNIVLQPCLLKSKDKIRIGDTRLIVEV